MATFPLDDIETIAMDSCKLYEFADEAYLVYRLSDGYFASSAKCTHLFKSLRNGAIVNDKIIRCPLHRAEFDIRTGEVEKWACFPPGVQLLNAVRPEKALTIYSIIQTEGRYFLQV